MTDPITKLLELTVHHTSHGDGLHSLTINICNAHVSLSSHAYPHCPGNRNRIDIFGITPEDALKLGNLITAEAFKIKGLQEAGNADKV